VSGAKSDAADAVLLANIVRTDPGAHRALPADTEAAQAIRCWPAPNRMRCGARQQIGNPGLGNLTGARVLAEIGDDHARFADARGLKAYAGSAPITCASGKKTMVLHRHIKNGRLAAVGPIWALGSLRASPGARRHFDARRATGDWNHQAQRNLFNKFVGQLRHCLQTRRLYNEHQAFPHPLQLAA
jgi:hypothetical protein